MPAGNSGSEGITGVNRKVKYVTSGVLGFLSGLLAILVRTVDVAAIGPDGTSIGLSHINKAVFDAVGVNMLWYRITDWLGAVALLPAAAFAAMGFVQWVRRKNVLKVDRRILALGGLYCALAGLYVFFETVVVNYRPMIMPGGAHPEASFPSTHTMLVCVVMGSTIMLLDAYICNAHIRRVMKVLCAAIIAVTVAGRLASGVHWFTDIAGGCLISAALLMLYSALTSSENR